MIINVRHVIFPCEKCTEIFYPNNDINNCKYKRNKNIVNTYLGTLKFYTCDALDSLVI